MEINLVEMFLAAASQFWWAWLLLALVAIARLPQVKGWLGELWIRLVLAVGLDGKSGRVVHDLTLPTADGTTQIDHVLVSRFGIFVIETKNMRGWIFGSERQAQWTQKIYRRSFRFQNPLRQNYRHERAVAEVLGVDPEKIHSVVVFVGGSTFKTPMPDNVVRGLGLLSYIRSFREEAWSEGEVEEMVTTLEHGGLERSRHTRRAHVEGLRERHAAPAAPGCPKCGSAMVKRKARKGASAGQQFWGCSQYPACRGIRALQ
ncbi:MULTISPECIES: nuclease-related domain-containing protein [unclassified Thioalkalivibrio]|uniref:nuclease-related domain-containing protein n=1 Tax=unclassified Thioalkalivibrio TaxID=2621013 RepID=UPI000409E6BC|nr:MULTISPECIES: NERD domain-containing protein [unclassified Thioalkalivibrio]PYG04531.1 Zn-finger domain associated with topoisomerase type I [Thioalkalivibrio sp. ALE21]